MIDWLTERARATGIVALLVLMTLFDSVSKIISIVGDGAMALIAIGLLWPILVRKKKP